MTDQVVDSGNIDYRVVLDELRERLDRVRTSASVLRVEADQLQAAIAVIAPLAGTFVGHASSACDAIVLAVTAAGRWMTQRDLSAAVLGAESTPTRQHIVATQVGQLVKRARLIRHGRLIGLPGWTLPPPELLNNGVVTLRNGRSHHVATVLREAQRPLHLREIGSELARRGFDADERCVMACLQAGMLRSSPRWRRVAPSTFESTEANVAGA